MTPLQPVFVHGWACGPDIWHPLQHALGWHDFISLDLGYYKPAPDVNAWSVGKYLAEQNTRPKLFIGHSLGFEWLLTHCLVPEGSRVVAINGFGRFAADISFEEGVPERVLRRMISSLKRDTAQGVNSFRSQCGLPDVAAEACCTDMLRKGLEFLVQGDVRSKLPHLVAQGALVALAATQDPIVTPDMTLASFPPDMPLHWQEGADHMLPLSHPEFCAAQIKKIIE